MVDPHHDHVVLSSQRDDEAQLLARLRAGEPDALTAIVRTFALALTRSALRYVDVRDVADEVVQETFIALWMQRDQLSIRSTLRGYLFTAVRNRALNVVRDARGRMDRDQRTAAALADEWRTAHETGDTPSESLRAAVRAAVAALPDRVRQAALLRWQDGLSRAEVAQVMGVSVATVNNQLTVAARRLREALQGVVSSDLQEPG